MFVGAPPSSKSIMNRALIAKSFSPSLNLNGDSKCDDVRLMYKAIEDLKNGAREFECGHAGTVLRFLAPRLAREKGVFRLNGSTRLFQRPQKSLEKLLLQLGAIDIQWTDNSLSFNSDGWRQMGDALHISAAESSQFLSGVLLSAWELPFDLALVLPTEVTSVSYLQLTLEVLARLGMDLKVTDTEIIVPKSQKVGASTFNVEPDMSSAFALAVAAVLAGEIRFKGIPDVPLQPDGVFFDILESMGVDIEYRIKWTRLVKTKKLHGVDVDLSHAPDLFPVLAVLCCFAQGRSRLFGAEQLRYKESNRISAVSELLTHLMVRFKELPDGIEIEGPMQIQRIPEFNFDTQNDHRMAMAAGLLKLAHVPVNIIHPEVVDKSFPEFFSTIGVQN